MERARPSPTSPGPSDDYSDDDVSVIPPRRSQPQRGAHCRRRSDAVTPRRENVDRGRREMARSSSRGAHLPGEPASRRSKIVGDANPDELHGVRVGPRRSPPQRGAHCRRRSDDVSPGCENVDRGRPSPTSPSSSHDYSDEDVSVIPQRRSQPQRGAHCRRRSDAVTPRRENVDRGRCVTARLSSRGCTLSWRASFKETEDCR